MDLFVSLGLVGTSAVMQRLRHEVQQYAACNATVLVSGETGSGKELVAHALHRLSPRAAHPFVAVNVATFRRDLLTSELIGHERGSFTGAVLRHRGVFEQANGGTLLLDEIGELDVSAQADLLRVLETGEVRPVGSERSRTVDVRLVVATHRDLTAMINAGTFRSDLYYRLHVLPVSTPPLRDRIDDLPAFVHHLLLRLRPEAGERTVTPEALVLLGRYHWPGNVRQLLNVLRRAAARSSAPVLGVENILEAIAPEPGNDNLTPRGKLTPPVIDAALQAAKGNLSGAARQLGVPRSTLNDRIRAYRREPVPETP